MAEINNSLALAIKPDPIDIGSTLQKAATIRALQTKSELEQSETTGKNSENMGRIGNILANTGDVDRAVEFARSTGMPINEMAIAHLRSLPKQEIMRRGQAMMFGGQNSTQNFEQNPAQVGARAAGSAAGALQGPLQGGSPSGFAPPAIGGGVSSGTRSGTGGSSASPAGSNLLTRTKESTANADALSAERAQYRREADEALTQKAAMRDLINASKETIVGQGSDKVQAARKFVQMAGQLIPGVADFAKKFDTPVAAFEAIQKNSGLISRSAQKGIGGTAARELDAISASLPSTETSERGIEINGSTMIGQYNYQLAKTRAAEAYFNTNGTMDGFAREFNSKVTPAAFRFWALPSDLRQSVRDNLNKTKEGKEILQSLGRQLAYIKNSGLHEGID